MTERLADIRERIQGVRDLGAVVNAMRGIAAARAQQARVQIAAVDGYATTIANAILSALTLARPTADTTVRTSSRPALVVFSAEQGFAGAFSERVLDAVRDDLASADLYLIGARGASIAAERSLVAIWKSAMPAQSVGIPRLADRIAEALYARIATGTIGRLDVIFSRWRSGHGVIIERQRLLPLDIGTAVRPAASDQPLVNLAPGVLLGELAAEFLHARLCHAALHAFAAESEARMAAMAAAHRQIERQHDALQATQRLVRQEEITAEIIELAAGEAASRHDL